MEALRELLNTKEIEKWSFDGQFFRRKSWTAVKATNPEDAVKAVKKTEAAKKYLKARGLPSTSWYSDGKFFYRPGLRYKYEDLKAVALESENVEKAKEHLAELDEQKDSVHDIMRRLVWKLKGSAALTFEIGGGDVHMDDDDDEDQPPPALPMPPLRISKKGPKLIAGFTVDLTFSDSDEDENSRKNQSKHLGCSKPNVTVPKLASFISEITGLSKVPNEVLPDYPSLVTEFWVAVAVSHVLYDLQGFIRRYKSPQGAMHLIDDCDFGDTDEELKELEQRITLVHQVRDGSRSSETLVMTMSPEAYKLLIQQRNVVTDSLESLQHAKEKYYIDYSDGEEDDVEEEDKNKDGDNESEKEDDVTGTVAFAKRAVSVWSDIKEEAVSRRRSVPDESVFRDFMDAVALGGKHLKGFMEELMRKSTEKDRWWVRVAMRDMIKKSSSPLAIKD